MDRRGFLGAVLAGAAAPAFVRASSLMRLSGIIIPAGISIPTTAEVVAINGGNSLLTIDMITAKALAILEKSLAEAFQSTNRLMAS